MHYLVLTEIWVLCESECTRERARNRKCVHMPERERERAHEGKSAHKREGTRKSESACESESTCVRERKHMQEHVSERERELYAH